MKGLHRQSFASIQLPSISGQINEGLEGRAGRGHRGLSGGATARCWRRKRMGIKRTQAVIREEFQQSSNRSGDGGWVLVMHCKKKNGH